MKIQLVETKERAEFLQGLYNVLYDKKYNSVLFRTMLKRVIEVKDIIKKKYYIVPSDFKSIIDFCGINDETVLNYSELADIEYIMNLIIKTSWKK
jgi:hypothetical protein